MVSIAIPTTTRNQKTLKRRATFPPELIVRPVVVSCPPGGTILDPFGGSGTTAAVATGNGRNCISIDLDERNLDLARERVGMFLESA